MSLEALIQAMGLPGIAAGVAIEGEGAAFLGGVLAHRGFFPVEASALAATAGAMVSDHALFGAGRHAGRGPRVQRMLATRGVGRLRGMLERHPDLFVLISRFLYGARMASAVLLGTTGVPWRRFLALNFVAVLVWAHAVTWLGYAGGIAIHRMLGHLAPAHHLVVALALAAAVGGAAFLLHRRLRRTTLAPVAE